MKNIIKPITGLFVLASIVLASCTDVESLSINESTIKDQNPEASGCICSICKVPEQPDRL